MSKLCLYDRYVVNNDNGDPIGILQVEIGFDIMKLKAFTLPEALVYLENNHIPAIYMSGVKGRLHFKKQEVKE